MARESRDSSGPPTPLDEPPQRGLVDQQPLILEAHLTDLEAARLHEQQAREGLDGNPERRFVFVSRAPVEDEVQAKVKRRTPERKNTAGSEYASGADTETLRPTQLPPSKPPRPVSGQYTVTRPETDRHAGVVSNDAPVSSTGRSETLGVRPGHKPELGRRKSRQDLPSIETKMTREAPPSFRRSTSSYDSPRSSEERLTPKLTSASSLLTPELVQSAKNLAKDFFGIPTSTRPEKHTSRNDKRYSSGNPVSSRSSSPVAASRSTFDSLPYLSPISMVNIERPRSRQSERVEPQAGEHQRYKSRGGRGYYSSSEDGSVTGDGERRSVQGGSSLRVKQSKHGRARSRSMRGPEGDRSSTEPESAPGPSRRADTLPRERKRDGLEDGYLSPASPSDSTPRAQDFLNPMDTIPMRTRSRAPSRSGRTVQAYDGVEHDHRTPRPGAYQQVWQPPAFAPPPQVPDERGGRRVSADLGANSSSSALPTCPRTTYTRGRYDWLTLPSCPNFNICPSCYNSTFATGPFRTFFTPAPMRSADEAIVCDLGSLPWYRIAYLLIVKEQQKDLRLFYGLANVQQTTQMCLGRHEAVRPWYSIVDSKSGELVSGWNVCYSCVRSVETLLPNIRGVFVRKSAEGLATPSVCDLRFDSKRFVSYFDALEGAHESSDLDGPYAPDTRNLVRLVRRKVAVDECPGDDVALSHAKWFIIPSVPDFTVCEECYDDIVWPELDPARNGPGGIADAFQRSMVRIPSRRTCQLGSERKRMVWRKAVERNDVHVLTKELRGERGERRERHRW